MATRQNSDYPRHWIHTAHTEELIAPSVEASQAWDVLREAHELTVRNDYAMLCPITYASGVDPPFALLVTSCSYGRIFAGPIEDELWVYSCMSMIERGDPRRFEFWFYDPTLDYRTGHMIHLTGAIEARLVECPIVIGDTRVQDGALQRSFTIAGQQQWINAL